MRLTVLLMLTALLASPAWANPADEEFFEKEVRPILVARCYECHSAKKTEPAGGLRVDSRESLLQGGDTGAAIKPGNAKESLLIDAVNYGDVYQMPPKTRMPAAEIAVLVKWIDLGAPWPKDPTPTGPAGSVKKFDLAQRKADWWCWQPIQTFAPPPVNDAAWPKQDLDRFILARLEAANLPPAPQADKRTLIRRASFTLIGLPPTPEEVAAFLADNSPQAFAKVVDRLLESPRFGERWARHWLDLVRYAESRGHEFEPNIPNAWQYRDYVIRALNADTPYDQFIREQIAGDLLQPPRTHPERGFNESQLGTGFWFLGEEVHSPVDIRKDETDRLDNRLDVMSKTFLGVTIACARCHDHKFDAISQRDYYALMGCLISSSYRQAPFETQVHNEQIAADLRALRKQASSAIGKERLSAAERLLSFGKTPLLAAMQVLRGEKMPPLDEAQASAADSWLKLLRLAEKEPASPLHTFARLAVHPATTEDSIPGKLLHQLLREREPIGVASPELVVDFSNPQPGDWTQDGFAFELLPAGAPLFAGQAAEAPLAGWADRGQARFDPVWAGLKKAPGTDQDHGALGNWDRSGKTLRTREFRLKTPRLWYLVQGSGRAYAAVHSHLVIAGPLHGALLMEWQGKPGQWQWVSHNLAAYAGDRLHVEFSPKSGESFAVAAVALAEQTPALPVVHTQHWVCGIEPEAGVSQPTPATCDDLASKVFANLVRAMQVESTDKQKDLTLPAQEVFVVRNWLFSLGGLARGERPTLRQDEEKFIASQTALLAKVRWESQTAPVMVDGNGFDEQLLIRGNSRTPGQPEPRRFLEAVDPAKTAYGAASSGRLTLAQQIASADNPLTSRVIVNRLWHHVYGRGLVATVDNLGVLGEKPTHPELLDYLAREFTRDGWSIKRMLRTMVLSSTFQMSSREPDDAALARRVNELDPQNLLWRRANIRRLEGEAIRDAVLAVSGRLDPKPFGPSVPVHLTPFMQGRGRPGQSGPLDGDGRRSVYIAIRRNFLPPMMLAFDMPIPFSTVGRRNVSNVPAQALILMNDPFVGQQAEVWARRLLAESGLSAEQRIERGYQQAFARPPTAAELRSAQEFLAAQAAELGLPPAAAHGDLRCWTDLCHVLFNVKEFVYCP